MEKAKKRKNDKESSFKVILSDLKILFDKFEVFLYGLILYLVSGGYFYLISKNIVMSLFFGSVASVFFFLSFVYKSRKLKRYQEDLNSLLKYVSNMTFFLQSGENVLYSLKATKNTLSDRIQKEVDVMIASLEKEASLNTEHFLKYKFPTLNQFHQNLEIKYLEGGDSKDLFGNIQRDMMLELKKRDELSRKRKGFAINVYALLVMGAVMPLILRFMTPELWDVFLEFKLVSLTILLIANSLVMLNLHFLQKHVVDISVRM